MTRPLALFCINGITFSESWSRKNRVPKLSDSVVECICRRVACTGVQHVWKIGLWGRKYAVLFILVRHQTHFSRVLNNVSCMLYDKDRCGHHQTQVLQVRFDAEFNSMWADEVFPLNPRSRRKAWDEDWYSSHGKIKCGDIQLRTACSRIKG